MEVIEAVRSRRSIGKVSPDAVAEAEIRELIEAATWAPNHHLTEPWKFSILTGPARERLGETWAAVAADKNGLSGEERDKFVDGERQKALRAPVLAVVSTRTDDDPVVAAEDFAATAAAVQNLLLVAAAKGLGTVWRTGGMAYDPTVKKHLGLDAGDRIVAIVYLGHPAMQPPQSKGRKSVDEVIRWINGA